AILATQLAKRPHLRTLVKKIHISPVVRLRGNDDDDAVVYTKIIRSCKDTVEQLAIGLHACRGALHSSGHLTATDTHQLRTGLMKEILFPSLRHLTIECKGHRQIEAIEWACFPQLRSVTFLTEDLFGDDHIDRTLAVDLNNPHNIHGGQSLYESLSLLPSGVTTVTFAFTGLNFWREFPDRRSGFQPCSPIFSGADFAYFTASLNSAFKRLVQDRTQEGEGTSNVNQIQLLRLVWPYKPFDGVWEDDDILRPYRNATYDLPKLRKMTSLEERYSQSSEPVLRVDNVEESREGSHSPKLEMYEVDTPIAWQSSFTDRCEIIQGKLEVVWKALLYNTDGDTLDEGSAPTWPF
ncbi:hypothetical protein CF319_g4394, partial [Tilletia indica]